MEKRGLSLAEIQEIPRESLTLVIGPPGAGKSAFCHQVVLNSIAANRPVIFVTTEQSPSGVMRLLIEKGIGSPESEVLNFIDAFSQTVGVEALDRPDTICADCADLNSISIATTRLQERIGKKGILLAFDSLTSPYLFSGIEVTKFMRLFLSKFAAEGNSVLALIDEGCGKEEDLGAMLSVADGILRIETKEGSRIINVVKHPKVAPTEIKLPVTGSTAVPFRVLDTFWGSHAKSGFGTGGKPPIRTEMGDFVNVFWLSFVTWGGMLWDPKRFPSMLYDLTKDTVGQAIKLVMGKKAPWYLRLAFKALRPKSCSDVGAVKRVFPRFEKGRREHDRDRILEYISEISKKDEHYFRAYEGASCWGLEGIGAPLCFSDAADLAGTLKSMEKQERDWNVVETACVGEGFPYCEFKAVPGELDELKARLTTLDSSIVQRIEERLIEHVAEFILHGKPLGERLTLGSGVYTHGFVAGLALPALASERYRMAIRMGGAMTGKRLGEHLMNAGIGEDEVVERVIDFMEYCKVGKVTIGETIRMRENCEAFGLEIEEPCCFFTTGFLNGLFSAVKKQHVREVKCIAAGDPYCEWEIV
jgi:predicted hydrocarbon binding protein/KaiC/GvpD/RAD55 family RecA-like ATPase